MGELLLDKVLVTTDLSEQSEAALEAVRPLCAQLGARVTLLHVTEYAPEGYGGPLGGHREREQEYRRAVKRMLLDQLDAMRRRHFGQGEARVAVIDGRPVWKAVCEYAANHGYGLIASATHGRSGADRWLVGSVAEQIARHAHCPVMTVRPKAE